ncbi:hypothetical protein KDA10_03645, partial [candidate division WWE3 bacterium]|nr:hypothetical protein [candidate division WWE3 bacterium]
LLNNYIKVGTIEIKSIEIFEPKPDADVTKLKPGIEHISLISPNFDDLHSFFIVNGLPVDKMGIDEVHKFFKTKLINMIEIEFRNDCLYKKFEK